jgi:predicted amidohydrolase YtcJ
VLVNSAVLADAGIGDDVEDPPGGRFVRDAAGRLTGLCLDAACGAVVPTDIDIGSHGPNFHTRAPLDTLVAAVDRASRAFLAAGLTCVADAQVTSRELTAYREARDRGVLGVRTVCMPLSHQLEAYRAVGLVGPVGDDRLSIGHLKVYADGTLTGGTAAFSDELEIRGQEASFFHEPSALVRLIGDAWTAGWRVAVHAQGDVAIAHVLDGFERGSESGAVRDPRPRIEHCGFPTASGIERMRRLGVTAVNQPSYLFDYGDEYAAWLGDHVHDLQPWRDELEAGVRVVISSDSDVSSYRPLTSIANAMLRRTRDGAVLGARHRLTLDEALFAHTIDAAYAVGLEHRIGSLEPMKAADLTILGGDIRSAGAEAIADLPVLATIVDGEVRFDGR